MIPAISKTLANLLAIETSLTGIDQVDFNPPAKGLKAALNIYCYNYCCEPMAAPKVDLAFVISAWNTPIWGEQSLLSEALSSLQKHHQLEVSPGQALSVEVNSIPAIEPVVLWESLGLPMRPAIYVTVKVAS
jgi:hypothetical protein